jgi:predicted CxxxxCH...CXXCH cytochrome family protein
MVEMAADDTPPSAPLSRGLGTPVALAAKALQTGRSPPIDRTNLLTLAPVGADSQGTEAGHPRRPVLTPHEVDHMRSRPLLLVTALTGSLLVGACGGSAQTPPPSASNECTGCHGDASRSGTSLQQAAPPLDAHGQSSETTLTVGAHQAHVYGGVACDTCHVVPAAGDRTHIAGPYATVAFAGNLVGAQGATVAPWNRDQPTCANYCHGDFTNGNKLKPAWNSGVAMTCNSCHGAGTGAAATPPGGTHPQAQPDCSKCHTGYTTTTVNASLHLNGRFDVATLTCTSCHGDATRPGTALSQAAPPVDSHGHSGTNEITVGAHQAHLANGVACATCHEIPPAGDTTHSADPYATVVFSGNLVGANGTPVAPWNRDQGTCSNYCHGASMPLAAVPTPLWTRATPLGCGACHGDMQTQATATGLHVLHLQFVTPLQTCADCHGDGYGAGAVVAPATATHHDGLVDTLPAVGWQDARCVSYGPKACFATCHTAAPGCKVWQ